MAGDAQFTAPAAAAGAAITPNSTAWANSAYAELLASVSAAAVLTGIVVYPTTSVSADFELDIATGAASAEVVIATVKGMFLSNVGWDTAYIPLPIPIDNIASGARLSARLRKSGSDVNAWRATITYLKQPLVGTVQTTATPLLVVPAAAAVTALPLSFSWASTAWTTIIASTATAIVLTHVVVVPLTGADTGLELDIGTGAASAEVVRTTVRRRAYSSQGGPWIIPLPSPLDNIGSGVRVAVRARADGAQAGCGLMYLAKPL